MTVLTLTRVPRRMFRKLTKPAVLLLNKIQLEQSEFEVTRIQLLRAALAEAESIEHRNQVKLMQQQRAVEAW